MSSRNYPVGLSSVSGGFRRYFQVILALLRKEELKRRRAPMESLGNLLEPVALLGTMATLWWFLDRRQFIIFGGSPLLFYATGFFVLYFFIYISRRMRPLPRARRLPIERRLDHVVVHILLRISDYALLGIAVFGGMYFLVTPAALPQNPVPLMQALLATIAIGFGWGILNLVVSNKIPFVNYVFAGFNRTLIFVSGVLLIPDFLSPAVRYVLSFNPMLHIVILFRQGFYPTYPDALLDTSYLAMCCLIAVAGGLVLERVAAKDR